MSYGYKSMSDDENEVKFEDGFPIEETDDDTSCSFCVKSFSSRIALQIHIQIVHTDIKAEIEDGNACPEPLTLETLEQYSCDACSDTFPSESDLQTHINEVHLDCKDLLLASTIVSPRTKNCTLCPNFFFCNYALRKHIQTMHPEADAEAICPRKQIRRPVNDLPRLPCTMCPKLFLTKGSLQRHYSEVHGFVNYLRRKRNRPTADNRHGPVFPCPLCKKSLGRAYYLRKHVLEIHPDVNVDEICPLKQKRRRDVKNLPTHSCTACDKSFLSRGALQRHTKKIHGYALDPVQKRPRTKLKPVNCPVCRKECQNKYFLQRHIYSTHPDFEFAFTGIAPKSVSRVGLNRSCAGCNKRFISRFGLWRHTRVVHGCTPDFFECPKLRTKDFKTTFRPDVDKMTTGMFTTNSSSSEFVCSFCSKGFAYKQSLRKHIQLLHTNSHGNGPTLSTVKETAKEKTKEKTTCIICPVCMMNIEDIIGASSTKSKVTLEDLVKHLNAAHSQDLVYENLKFVNEELFMQWYNELQTDTSHSFRMHKVSATNTFCYCIQTSRNERKSHSKVETTCPAHFVVRRCPDNRINIKYLSKHYCDSLLAGKSDHLQKLKSDQKWIDGKLLDQIPIEVVLQNIETKFRKRKDGAIPIAIDSSGSTEYVSLYEINDYSPIILYKRQGMNTFDISPHGVEISGCDVDEFLFVTMDAHQCETLMRYGSGDSSVVCVDTTIDQEQLDTFHLSVLMVRDENKNAFPAAYMYSNRNTESTFTLFFHAIRSRTGVVNCNTFISDMAPMFYNAWNIIMGCCPRHLYSPWQVDESFRTNTNLYITNDNKLVAYVYKKLRALLEEDDVGRLEKAVSNLMWKLAENPVTAEFGEFFETHYVSTIELWARCYRARSDVGTNNHLERMHNIFKHVYVKCMKNCHLDVAISSLLNLVYNDEFYRVVGLCDAETVQTFDDRVTFWNVNDKGEIIPAEAGVSQTSYLLPINSVYHETEKQLKDEVALLIETVGDRREISSVIDSLRALKPKVDHTSSRDNSATGLVSPNEFINKLDTNGGILNGACTIAGSDGETYELLPVENQGPEEVQLELDCICE